MRPVYFNFSLRMSFFPILIVAFAVLLVSCSENQNAGENTSGNTGSIAFSVAWQDSPGDNDASMISPQALTGDVCQDFEIAWVVAKVYNESEEMLKGPIEWNCNLHTATISKVTPGRVYMVIEAHIGDVDDSPEWRGQSKTVLVTAGAQSNVGKVLVSHTSDDTPPTILSTNPEIVDVPIDSAIIVTFDEEMSPVTLDTSTFILETDAGQVSGSVAYDTMTATFTPDSLLNYNTVYTATITDGAMDIAGNQLTGSFSWSFSTAKVLWLGIQNGAILKISTDQKELANLDQVNCRGLSGYSQFAVDPNDNSLWLADSNSDRVIKVDENGELLFVIDQWSAHGTVVDPRDGSAWTSKLYQNPDYNRTMVNYSPLGFIIRETAGGLDSSMFDNAMAWNSSDHSIWYANYDTDVVKLMNTHNLDGYDASGATGTNHLRINVSGQTFETSVFSGSATSPNAPCVWVVNRNGSNVIKLDINGNELLRRDPSGITEVRFVSADPNDGSVWIGGLGSPWRVAKYAYDGTQLVQAVAINEYFDTIETDPMDGGLWIGTRDASLIRLGPDGTELWRYAVDGEIQSLAFPLYPIDRKKIYVAETGDDINGNGSEATPYQSIGKAQQEAGSGDSIQVGSGTYNENVILKSGVNIIGAGPDTTTIQGLGTTHVMDGLAIFNVTLSGFTITGSGETTSGIYCDDCVNFIIRNNIIRDNGNSTTSNGISLQSASEALIERNIISGNAESGMVLSGDGAFIVRNNIIINNEDSGIYRGYGDRVSYIVNNVIDSNGNHSWGRSGLMIRSNDIISNNLITNNGGDNPNAGLAVGIWVYPAVTPTLSYNNVWNNYQGSYTNITAGTGDISLDPQYENLATGDYSLQATSPSINAGDPGLYDPDCTRSAQGAYGGPFGNW